MSKYVIESGVEIPAVNVGAKMKYPFIEMSVGDSFLVEVAKDGSIRSAAVAFSQKNNVKFTVRKVDGGIRVWRTK